jgi:hypothetical protein
MNKNRVSATVLVIAVVTLAIATSSFTSAPAAANSATDDFGLRHPGGMPGSLASVVVNYAGSELARNDPDFALRSSAIDTSDYFLRHPELITTSLATVVVHYAGSDLAANDPEFSLLAGAIDTSDYFLRHPELIQAAAVDTSDYALRHPELSRK